MVSVQFFVEVGRSSGCSKKKSKKNLVWDFGIQGFLLGLATMVIEKSHFSIRYLENWISRISNV
jgi:hypothetical protein